MSPDLNATASPRNGLLRVLPAEVLEDIRPHLQPVTMVLSQVLHEVGSPIDHVYFVEAGLVSLTADTGDAGMVEVGMTGVEGVVGLSALLVPGTVAFHRAFTQVPGSAMRMRVPNLRAMAERHPALLDRLYRYQHFLMVQASQAAACNARHDLPRRLARWILMSCDRIGADDLPMTQEFVAMMLGVRRAGVSVIANDLQERGLISQRRGRVVVLDRAGLEEAACACYRIIEDGKREIMSLPE